MEEHRARRTLGRRGDDGTEGPLAVVAITSIRSQMTDNLFPDAVAR